MQVSKPLMTKEVEPCEPMFYIPEHIPLQLFSKQFSYLFFIPMATRQQIQVCVMPFFMLLNRVKVGSASIAVPFLICLIALKMN